MLARFLFPFLLAGVSYVTPTVEPLVGTWEAVEFASGDEAPQRMCLVFSEAGRYTLVANGRDDRFVFSWSSSYSVDGSRLTMAQDAFDQFTTFSFESTNLVVGFMVKDEVVETVRFRRPVADLPWCSRHLEPEKRAP